MAETTLDQRRRSLVELLARAARDTGTGTFTAHLRSRLGRGSDDRTALVTLIEELVAADDRLAEVAPSVGTLLRSRMAADAVSAAFATEPATVEDLDDVFGADDILRIARVRGQAERAILAEPMFDAVRVARALGSSSRNPREFARQVRSRPGLLSLRVGNRFVFPAFQFNEARHEIWPTVAEVNALLGAADDPWGVASFWFTTDPHLRARPADLVVDRDRAADIRDAAQREVAPVG